MAALSIVRTGTASDLEALVRLEKVGFTSDQFPPRQLRYLLNRAHATVFITEQRGQV